MWNNQAVEICLSLKNLICKHCTALYSYVQHFTSFYSLKQLYITFYKIVQPSVHPCTTMYRLVPPLTKFYNHVQCSAMYNQVQPCKAMYSHVKPSTTLHSLVAALYDYVQHWVQHCTTLYNIVQPFTAMFNNEVLFSFPCNRFIFEWSPHSPIPHSNGKTTVSVFGFRIFIFRIIYPKGCLVVHPR